MRQVAQMHRWMSGYEGWWEKTEKVRCLENKTAAKAEEYKLS